MRLVAPREHRIFARLAGRSRKHNVVALLARVDADHLAVRLPIGDLASAVAADGTATIDDNSASITAVASITGIAAVAAIAAVPAFADWVAAASAVAVAVCLAKLLCSN